MDTPQIISCPVKPSRQTQLHQLERILTMIIGLILVIAGLCMYYYLVGVYESHCLPFPASHPGADAWPATCISHARWAPIKPQPLPGHPEIYQSHAWFALPADGLETLVLLSQDRRASGTVSFAQSPRAVSHVIEIEVQAFYESLDALRPERRTVCALRRSQGRYGIGVFAASGRQSGRDDGGARDRVALNVTVWLPGPRSGGSDAAFRVTPCLESDYSQFRHATGGDSPIYSFGRESPPVPPTDAPIELISVRLRLFLHLGGDALAHLAPGAQGTAWADKTQDVAPARYVRGKFNVTSYLELAATREPIAAGAPAYADNHGFHLDTQMPGTVSSASIQDSGFFHVDLHSPFGIGYFEQALDSDVDSAGKDMAWLGLACKGSFNLPAKVIRPHVNAEPGTEDLTEESRTRRMTSRIIGRGTCLIRGNLE
ncbi:hypothetical protein F5148DRAFT_1285450 [Russula earlei]|uniref:Uncharacterized protein n=1 Tax=Russula earlei TaxID=71964 RepID=A0ACC0U6E6_9AGAM|nr:hypothetical protein F5148DRAFT_1285450 [Russula earlei]